MEQTFRHQIRRYILGQNRKNQHPDHHTPHISGAESIDTGGAFVRFISGLVKQISWHYSWVVPLVLFLVHQYLQHWLGLRLELADAYLDPFCAGALALTAVSFERRLFFGQQRLTVADIVVTTGYIIFVSEVLFPYFSDRFIADWLDAVAIVMGMGWFLLTRYLKLIS